MKGIQLYGHLKIPYGWVTENIPQNDFNDHQESKDKDDPTEYTARPFSDLVYKIKDSLQLDSSTRKMGASITPGGSLGVHIRGRAVNRTEALSRDERSWVGWQPSRRVPTPREICHPSGYFT
jgi:hypothetical protein